MFRWVFVVLLVVSIQVSSVTAQTPVAGATNPAAAKQAFDQLSKQWADLYVQLQQKGSGSRGFDPEVKALTKQIEAMVDKIVVAGLNVHRAGLTDDPKVNSTLISIASFYVTGDSEGDGGDQYEKALPIIKSMLDGGLGNTAKELWLLGGVSAFYLNEFNLAEQYFLQAQKLDLLGNTPLGQGIRNPLNRVWSTAKRLIADLPATRQAWQKEQAIRAQEAAANNLPRVKFQTTRGDILIELFENEAPQAVASFISLVKAGFYDGVVFHRVLPSFMAQGGDPTGSGKGGPGYNIRCECHVPNYRKHFRGSLSMAHAGRNTGGSQFFLTFITTSSLDGKHTVFGRVVEGIDIAASLKRRDPDAPGPLPTPDKIVKAEVLRDRGHAYQFEKLPGR